MAGSEVTYSINDITTFFGLARFYLTLRLFEYYSHWTNDRSKRVCNIIGVRADVTFAMKAYLKSSPYIVLSIALILSLIFLGLALRIAERVLNTQFDFLANSFWLVIVTMTTSNEFPLKNSRVRGHVPHHPHGETGGHSRLHLGSLRPLPLCGGPHHHHRVH